MSRFKGPMFESFKNPPGPTVRYWQRPTPEAQVPQRALPAGKQWVAHDKPTGKAAARRRRQAEALDRKRAKRSESQRQPDVQIGAEG